jgi:NAD(P)-dependent dehydrogenase (short-subunit alcohol dehydrogenase family)
VALPIGNVLITGCSSGIGLQAAELFAERGWNVAATMRRPDEAPASVKGHSHVKLYALDVTSPESVAAAVDASIRELGRIDVLVNNAGFGADGVFEAMDDDLIRRQFETNVFGLMRLTRALIPHMRHNGGGTIIQIASMGGRLAFPLYSIYHASKWAVEGFTESLHYELRQFHISLKLIEPGAIRTEFYGRSRAFVTSDALPEYNAFVAKVEAVSQKTGQSGEDPSIVARAILRAATDGSSRMRYPIGKPAPMLLAARRFLPDWAFFWMVRRAYGIG